MQERFFFSSFNKGKKNGCALSTVLPKGSSTVCLCIEQSSPVLGTHDHSIDAITNVNRDDVFHKSIPGN